MCAIVDASVAGKLFSSEHGEADKKFFNWITSGKGRLVVGGQLSEELNKTAIRRWARQAIIAGLIRRVSDTRLKEREAVLLNQGLCKSDDPHVIALAQVSGARLLYSNDKNLQTDFKNKDLVNNPRGKVFSTTRSKTFHESHKRLLARQDLCRQA